MKRHEFNCIDGHTCGNPCRLVISGAPDLKGSSLAEYRTDFLENHDWVRQSLMFEPRGHDAMSGVILYPALRDDCDVGFLFIETSGCLPMCGHDTIGATTYIIEQELVLPQTPGRLAIETPAGKVVAHYKMDGAYVASVSIENIDSFLVKSDLKVGVDGLGEITFDVSYGGNYYAIIEPQENWSGLDNWSASELIAISPNVRAAIQSKFNPVHPDDPRICGVSHIMWCDKPKHSDADGRNAVFYGEKGMDRSPCGTGSSARIAQLAARGVLKDGDSFVHESIIGTLYHCQIDGTAKVAGIDAVKPVIRGWAQITGFNRIVVNPRDMFALGFTLK